MDSRLCESLLSFYFYFFVYKQNNAENSKNVIIIIGGDKRRPHNLDQTNLCKPGGWGGGVLGLMISGYVTLASQSPYPIIVYFLANNNK